MPSDRYAARGGGAPASRAGPREPGAPNRGDRREKRPPRPRPIGTGRVLGRAISTWFGGFLPFTAIAIACHAPWIAIRLSSGAREMSGSAEIGMALAGFGFSMLAGGALGHAVVKRRRGGEAPIGECLGAALRALLPITGLWLTLVVLEAIVLFVCGLFFRFVMPDVVPGVLGAVWLIFGFVLPVAVAYAAFWIAVPVVVVERVGVGRSLHRALALLRGSFWVAVRTCFVLAAAYVGTWFLAFWLTYSSSGDASVALWVVTFAQVVFLFPFAGIAGAVAYHDLRDAKEGAAPGELVEVFR